MNKVIIFFTIGIFLIVSNLSAQDEPRTSDKPGCIDYESISRYQSAIIQNCSSTDHDNYVLGLGSPVEKSFREHGKYFSKYLDLEGRITRIQYLIDKTEGIKKVSANYKMALKNAHYEILFTADNANWPFFNEDYYGGDGIPINNIKKYGFYIPNGSGGYNYITAKGLNKVQNDVYVSLFINYGSNYGKEFILVTEEIIEVNPVERGLVNAESISDMMDIEGHVSIYGIHFETGKSQILPESEDQIRFIAEYLNSHKGLKFYIVGHTDNVGNYGANNQLSLNRANAVIQSLITKYGVDPGQLEAHGIADLAPVTSNKSDKGKARNRRVEIVER